jgi:putative flippase GtrA
VEGNIEPFVEKAYDNLEHGCLKQGIEKRWFRFSQLLNYLIAGGVSAFVDWSFYWALINFVGLFYIYAAAISFVIATTLNYLLSVNWVFKGRGRFSSLVNISLVFFVSGVGLLINQSVLFILVEYLTLHYMLAKISATGIVFIWNFVLRKYYIFK